jgi:hypothetical protein
MKTTILLLSFFFIAPILKAQEKTKDTLFFNYDDKYIRTHVEIPHYFYLKDGSESNYGTFFFKEVKILNNLNSKEIRCLKKFIRSSRFYDKNKQPKLNDYKLWEYFNDYVVFFAKKNEPEYIEVKSGFEIE